MHENRLCGAITRLAEIMRILRSEDGCPWDADQTPESLRPFILEEAYEVLEAIDEGSPESIRDELGDLLLQVVFQSRIFEERGEFDLSGVAETIADKLVRRHPHVFGEKEAKGEADLDAQWERIKTEELKKRGKSDHPRKRIPGDMPALMRAAKLVNRSTPRSRNPNDMIDGLEKLLSDLKSARAGTETQESLLGEILFGMVELSGVLRMDPEDVLRRTVNRRIGESPDDFNAMTEKERVPPSARRSGAGK